MAAPMLKNLRTLSSLFSRMGVVNKRGLPGSVGLYSSLVSCKSAPSLTKLGVSSPAVSSNIQRLMIHTSLRRSDLNEFFDKKEMWGEPTVPVGRPYKMDELRLKSNSDLHKLWYVLLKERNMLMTMAEEYKRECEIFPSPERLEKVEDSMENILDVVRERDTAFAFLETGEPPLPGRRRWTYNQLGIGYWRKCREQHLPIYLHGGMSKTTRLSGPWQQKYIRLRREAMIKKRAKAIAREVGIYKNNARIFPDSRDNVLDLDKFTKTLAATEMKGPTKTDS